MNSYQNRKYFIPQDDSVIDEIRMRALRYGLSLGEAEEEFVSSLHTKITEVNQLKTGDHCEQAN